MYLSLIPIITGVAIATVTEISFDMIGLISALIATMGFSLQNIFSKKVLHDTGIHHLRLLHILGRLALIMFLPVWLVVDLQNVMQHPTLVSGEDYRVLALLFLDGVLNWLQNIVAFSVLSLVTPLTYAVASASKRIFVIAVSLFMLGNPVTGTNIFGMALAIFGVLFYNKAKYDARQSLKQQTVLPLSHQLWQNQTGYVPYASSPQHSVIEQKNSYSSSNNSFLNGGIHTINNNISINNNKSNKTGNLFFV